MKTRSIQVSGPNRWSKGYHEISPSSPDDVLVKPVYSAICRTDFSVIDGSLLYYVSGEARYPIITGHEWCGYADGQPVVGLCILGCGKCARCENDEPMYCGTRIETGVVNKDGGHSEYIYMPPRALLPIPNISVRYALVEPLAVACRAFNRARLCVGDQILVCGHGSIGWMVGETLKQYGFDFDVYDPKYGPEKPHLEKYDVVFECSGNTNSMNALLAMKGLKVTAIGFDYDPIMLGEIVSKEINIITTLGSAKRDFEIAIEMMPSIELPPYAAFELSRFGEALDEAKKGTKTILENHL